MPSTSKESKKTSFFEIIKNLFFLLIFLQFAPVLFSNIKDMFIDMLTPKTQVGKLNITGTIKDSTFYVKHIQGFLKNDSIKALYLKIDSPGGAAGSAQAIFQELQAFKKKKPIVAFIENTGASAAYQIAAASDHIVATPSSLVGSIGTILQMLPNIKGLGNDWNIKFRNIHSGKYKTSGSPFKDDTEDELKQLQSVSDDSYKQFIQSIATARNLQINNEKEWANGKIFTGMQALKLKLIDQIGSQQDASDQIKKLALIETEIEFVQPKRISPIMRLLGGQDDFDLPESGFSSWIAGIFSETLIALFSNNAKRLNSSI